MIHIPYARHYNPRFVFFLPTFESPKTVFQGAFFLKFWPYVRLVFKSGSNQERVMMARVRYSFMHFLRQIVNVTTLQFGLFYVGNLHS